MKLELNNDFLEDINNLLNYELYILNKKKNNETLTKNEFIFDIYLLKPSFLLRILLRNVERTHLND